jgi:hypothetical protein
MDSRQGQAHVNKGVPASYNHGFVPLQFRALGLGPVGWECPDVKGRANRLPAAETGGERSRLQPSGRPPGRAQQSDVIIIRTERQREAFALPL